MCRAKVQLPRSESRSLKPWCGHHASTEFVLDAATSRVARLASPPLLQELILFTACELRVAVARRNLMALMGADPVMRLHAARYALAEIGATREVRLLSAAIAGYAHDLGARQPAKWVQSLEESLAASAEYLDVQISLFAVNRVLPAQHSQSPRRRRGRANQESRLRGPAGLGTGSASPMAPRAKL